MGRTAPNSGGRRHGDPKQDRSGAGFFENRAEHDEDQHHSGDDAGRPPEHAVEAVPCGSNDFDQIDAGMLEEPRQRLAKQRVAEEQNGDQREWQAECPPRELERHQEAEITGRDIDGLELEDAVPQPFAGDQEPVDDKQKAEQQDGVDRPE